MAWVEKRGDGVFRVRMRTAEGRIVDVVRCGSLAEAQEVARVLPVARVDAVARRSLREVALSLAMWGRVGASGAGFGSAAFGLGGATHQHGHRSANKPATPRSTDPRHPPGALCIAAFAVGCAGYGLTGRQPGFASIVARMLTGRSRLHLLFTAARHASGR
jgi:hypothetical protein